MWSEQFRQRNRENIFFEITSKWPASMLDKLHTGVDDERIYPIWYKTLMAGEFDHIIQFANPDKAAIDVGALLGQYSLTLSSLSTKCLCIEPLKNYAFLEKVLPPNCHICTVAAGAHAGEGVMHTPDHQYGLSSLLINDWHKKAGIVTEQATEIKKLDDIVLQEFPGEAIGFVKIDVEGYELQVLTGATRLLQEHRPNLQIEIDPDNLQNARKLLNALGYSGFFFFDGRLHEIHRFQPEIHCNPNHAWTPEKANEFDIERYVVNFFFVPNQ